MNRYGQHLPTISRNYMSAILGRQDGSTYSSYENIVTPNAEAVKSNIVVASGSTTNIFSEPQNSENFNVIQISLDTMHINNDVNDVYNISLKQGVASTSLTETYNSPVKAKSNFQRNYPVTNNFFNIELLNNAGNDLHANVVVTLSKYTQFNPPSQLGDNIDFKVMTNLVRDSNMFIDDVSRGLVESCKLINIQGMMNSESANTHVVAPIEFQVPTSNSYAEVYAVSDSVSDNFEFDISGDTDVTDYGRIVNGLTLTGTTPSIISVNRYKSIDLVNLRGNVNSGNISIYSTGTNIPYNYIPKNWANTSAAVYYIQNDAKGVLKEIRVDGYSTLHVSRIRAVIQDSSTGIKEIWESRIADGDISRVFKPDYLIPSNSTLYIEMEGSSPVGTDQEINVNVKIIEYLTKPEKVNSRV